MGEWIALVVVLVSFGALSWWAAGAPDKGPGDALARKYRDKGGTWGL